MSHNYAREIWECRDDIDQLFFESRQNLPSRAELEAEEREEDDEEEYGQFAASDMWQPGQ